MLNLSKKIKNNLGFSLVEILVTISLISLIAAFSIPNLKKFNTELSTQYTLSDISQALKLAQSQTESSIVCSNGTPALNWNVEFKSDNYSFYGNCTGGFKDIKINGKVFSPDGYTQMVTNNCHDATFNIEFSKSGISATCLDGIKITDDIVVTLSNSQESSLLADIKVSKSGVIFTGFRKQDPDATPLPSFNPTPTPTPSPSPVPTPSPSPNYSNITFDNKALLNTSGNGSTKTYTFSHTTGTGSNRILLVTISDRNPTNPVSTITYGSQSLTKLASVINGTSAKVELWRLINPANGLQTVTVNYTNSNINRAGIVLGSVSFFGVDQTTPLGTYSSLSDSSANPTISVSSNSNELVLDVLGSASGTGPSGPGTGQTQLYNVVSPGPNTNEVGASSYKTGSLTTSMSWLINNPGSWAYLAVPLKPAAQ